MKRDLADPELFGNEAGEDEDIEILNSYFIEKNEFERFYSAREKIAFVRSRKGVGKSALLKQTLYRRALADEGDLLIYVKASDLVALQELTAETAAELTYGWQQRICSRINMELGSTLRLAIGDDSITLVESAEVAGFRGRNLVGSLIDRLKIKGVQIGRTPLVQTNAQALLKRIQQKGDAAVWLFIDDVDATFVNSEKERLRTSTFFSACRNLCNSVKGLDIRASVRTDVWAILAQHDEALDKCEQYMLDLQWSTLETGKILERKILSYFLRYYADEARFAGLKAGRDRKGIYALVFKEPFPWGGGLLEAFRPIHILSAGRPRWAAQLCKMAGKDAFSKKASRIAWGHVRAQLRDYGQVRLLDLYKEHRHQCPRLEHIIESFGGQKSKYDTGELLEHLTSRVIRLHGLPEIDGISAEQGSLTVAHFLFRIGFIAGRDESRRGSLEFVRYEDRPGLLASTSNLDDGLIWEVHPSYREALRIHAT